MPSPNSETACPSFQNTGVIPAPSPLPHPRSNLLGNLTGSIFKTRVHPHSACLPRPPGGLFFHSRQRDAVKTKSGLIPPLLHTLPGSSRTQGKNHSPPSGPQGLLQPLPLYPPFAPPLPSFGAGEATFVFLGKTVAFKFSDIVLSFPFPPFPPPPFSHLLCFNPRPTHKLCSQKTRVKLWLCHLLCNFGQVT